MELLIQCVDFFLYIIDIFLHLDKHLDYLIQAFGVGTYIVLFLIIFCETGLVVTPVLPGDSLLFAIGAFSARGALNLQTSLILLSIAAILGDTVNYWIGNIVGPRVFKNDKARFLNKKHLLRTHQFYEKHGGKTIIIARFMPFIRTFAPFVAGIGAMTYRKFIIYNVLGGLSWITLFVFGGYKFGNIPHVKKHFTLVIMAIVIISLIPIVVEFINSKRSKE